MSITLNIKTKQNKNNKTIQQNILCKIYSLIHSLQLTYILCYYKQYYLIWPLIMNQSYERALNEVSLLKKAINTQKTSHQNTLTQLEVTYQIIEDLKSLLKAEQQKNKSLTKEVNDKNNKIQLISREYEEHIANIKQLIDRKDLEIKKYTHIKVTDYDMIRLRVINQVEVKHTQQLQALRNQIKKHEFLSNEYVYQIKVLKQKTQLYGRQIEELKQQIQSINDQHQFSRTKQLNRLYVTIQQQKLSKKNLQKKYQQQREKHTELVKKYHQQLEAAQLQNFHLSKSKQNKGKYANSGDSISLLSFKENEFALENDKLKKNIKQREFQIEQCKSKMKSITSESRKQISELEKQIKQNHLKISELSQDLEETTTMKQKESQKFKKQLEKKEETTKQKYEQTIELKNKQLRKIKKQFDDYCQTKNQTQYKDTDPRSFDRDDEIILKKEIQNLRDKNKKLTFQLESRKSKDEGEIQLSRQVRATSVQEVKDKLKAANAQIVTLLRDKIALSDKIARLNVQK